MYFFQHDYISKMATRRLHLSRFTRDFNFNQSHNGFATLTVTYLAACSGDSPTATWPAPPLFFHIREGDVRAYLRNLSAKGSSVSSLQGEAENAADNSAHSRQPAGMYGGRASSQASRPGAAPAAEAPSRVRPPSHRSALSHRCVYFY